ncbi:DUF2884 family protein [Ferrimonas sp. SCSIO 43195]|uniref:DUF2884 family protein n=1 Tax=Ferrimonas sp. SCSIO 43195 TaxID=2822844 RepID=UPI002075E451|nr:DUF2884 family protein [Ferrimonas sp. SCSIO 43195]USD38182.1 DUF2884 family protein [Ferrimonas sp. SCSIO 43195]
MTFSGQVGVVLLSSTLFCAAANASECNFSFNHDLIVSDSVLELQEQGKTLYRFEDGELVIDGKVQDLDGDQRRALSQFQQAYYRQMPATMELVDEALRMAGVALDTISVQLQEMGIDAASLQGMMDTIAESVNQKVAREDGSYRVVSGDFDQFGDQFDQQFEQQLEQAITQSMGSLMMTLGAEMMNGDSGSFEQKMEEFGQRMERMGEEIEQQFQGQEQHFEAWAERVCTQWQQLDEMEDQLMEQVPQLQKYDQLKIEGQSLASTWF